MQLTFFQCTIERSAACTYNGHGSIFAEGSRLNQHFVSCTADSIRNASYTTRPSAQHGQVRNEITLVTLLKVYAKEKNLSNGVRLHDEALKSGLLQKNFIIGNALVNLYAKCNAEMEARQVFDGLTLRDATTWTALIAGYAQHGHAEESLRCFAEMQCEGPSPDALTFTCILKACGSIGAADKGKEIHATIAREGWLEKDSMLGTALVDMYAKCCILEQAKEAFDMLHIRNVVSWTAMITAYLQHGDGQEALTCFEKMQYEGFLPDAKTFACLLKACGSLGAIEKGTELHAKIVTEVSLGKDDVLGTTLVDMYAKCGILSKAQKVFNELPSRSLLLWNALIAGYSQHGHGEEAFKCFRRMQQEGFAPAIETISCILKACGSIGAVDKGKDIHAEITRAGLLEKSVVLGNALVDMYAKCGALTKAQEVFDELLVWDIVSWNVLVTAYCEQGNFMKALRCFEQMQREGFSPDAITFVSVLGACSFLSLVDEGQAYFNAMGSSHGIIPSLEHQTCIVDLYGRGGHLDEAVTIIKKGVGRDF